MDKKEDLVLGKHEEEEGEAESRRDADADADDDEKVLRFLDSLDRYLALLDSFSSTLRQGWLELASSRQSMGSSRISSVLLDHKIQPAATTLQINEPIDDSLSEGHPQFALSKWASPIDNGSLKVSEATDERKSSDSELRYRGLSGSTDAGDEGNSASNVSPGATGTIDKLERSRSLRVFGALVSPKLRSAQVSFESALDGIVEIANARNLMLSTYSQLKRKPMAQVD